MSTPANTVLVKTRMSGAIYSARAGRGKAAKAATCTMDHPEAARRAAAKFFRLDACNVQTADDIELRLVSSADGWPYVHVYRATLPAAGGAS